MRFLKSNQKKVEAGKVSEASIFSVFEESFLFFNLKGFFKKFALIFAILLFFNVSNTCPGSGTNSSSGTMYAFNPEDIYVLSVKQRIHDQLVVQVGDYIKNMAPTSELSPEILVTVCEKYDFDITFVMAQALLESHFGTRGKAAETNSVWNVGTYDNGTIKYRYSHPNESIEPYANLLYRNYLMWADTTQNSKNILELLQDKSFVNYNGYRFASATGYENALRKLMIKIDMETSISMLQGIRRLSDEELLTYFNPAIKSDTKDSRFYALNY